MSTAVVVTVHVLAALAVLALLAWVAGSAYQIGRRDERDGR